MPFTAEEVLYVFDTTHTHASEIIMLYYVLYYHDCLLANLIKRPPGVPFKEGVTMKKQSISYSIFCNLNNYAGLLQLLCVCVLVH